MPRADAIVARLVADPATTAILVDFDGSLAPIVDRPADARPLAGAGDVLGRLARHLGRVAVVSGRTVEFLQSVLPVAGVELAGLYGVERATDEGVRVDPRVAAWAGAIAAAATEAEARLPGVLVERKGTVSVTLHWRTCPGREREIRSVAAELAVTHGLDAPQRGRAALELRPPVPVDKGTAVVELVAGCRRACFAGDDAGDLPAFDALDRLAAVGTIEEAFRVGVRSSEIPAEIRERADLVLDGPEGLLAWLTRIADRLDADAGRAPA